MYQLYNTILLQPLLNLLIFLYNLVGDIGIAIIIVTIIIRLLLLQPSLKAIKAQMALQELQPKIKKIQEKYKNNKEQQSKELMNFYKENKVNPFSSCLPMLIQLPILFALYSVFTMGLTAQNMQNLYSFVPAPEHINTMFLNLVNMAQPNVVLAVLAGVLQFLQTKMMLKPKKVTPGNKSPLGDMSGILVKQMTYLMPAMTVFISLGLPSGLALYWIMTTLFAIAQQCVIMRRR
jgi:YidC/Oxa1 family membrane protein insertase